MEQEQIKNELKEQVNQYNKLLIEYKEIVKNLRANVIQKKTVRKTINSLRQQKKENVNNN